MQQWARCNAAPAASRPARAALQHLRRALVAGTPCHPGLPQRWRAARPCARRGDAWQSWLRFMIAGIQYGSAGGSLPSSGLYHYRFREPSRLCRLGRSALRRLWRATPPGVGGWVWTLTACATSSAAVCTTSAAIWLTASPAPTRLFRIPIMLVGDGWEPMRVFSNLFASASHAFCSASFRPAATLSLRPAHATEVCWLAARMQVVTAGMCAALDLVRYCAASIDCVWRGGHLGTPSLFRS